MKCIRYSVYVKKTGKLHYENFAWIDKTTDVNEWIKKSFNLNLVKVVIK
jgi:hypothetical protein